MRRIVQSPPSVQYSDLKIPPQWHQWLRYTRHDPPTIEELSQDVARQERLKILARQADERWAAKPSFLDQPGERGGQPLPATKVLDSGGYAGQNTKPNEKEGVRNTVAGIEELEATEAKKIEIPDGVRHPYVEREEHNEVRKDEIVKLKEEKADPWKRARGGPSEEWRPKAVSLLYSGNTPLVCYLIWKFSIAELAEL